jgi:hypothetical protein
MKIEVILKIFNNFGKFIWKICKMVLTLRPQNLNQMVRQNRYILSISRSQGLLDFERMICASTPSTSTSLKMGYDRHVCFSLINDIS